LAELNGIGEVTSVYQKSLSDNIEILRVQTETGKGEAFFDLMKSKFKDANLSLMKTTTIGATVGDSLKLNALISIALSILGLMLYVAFRFEMGYGIGAVVSTVINVIMTIIIYLMFGHQISSATIASILMVVGYSINDTIIVFDRIREELKEGRSKSLKEIINYSITRTLSRTILTSASTFLAALALYVFGSGVVVDFALIFLIGVVVGTFSSIFIASPVFYLCNKKDQVSTSVGVSRHTA
jgi:SecD/SecF fusion protein